MKAWALKTIDSYVRFETLPSLVLILALYSCRTTIKTIGSEYDLERAARSDEVVVLLLFSTETNKDDVVSLLSEVSARLIYSL